MSAGASAWRRRSPGADRHDLSSRSIHYFLGFIYTEILKNSAAPPTLLRAVFYVRFLSLSISLSLSLPLSLSPSRSLYIGEKVNKSSR